MFFKKRREAKKAAAAEARQNVIDGFQGRIDAAKKLDDPGETLLKLQDVANDVEDTLSMLSGAAVKDANLKQKLMFWTTMPAGIAVCAIYPPAILGLLGMSASVYGGRKLSSKFAEHAIKKNLEKERPFIDALAAQKTSALNAQDEIVVKNPRGVAASPHFTDLIARVPRLREQFAAAYGRKVNEEEAARNAAPASKKWTDDPNFKFGS